MTFSGLILCSKPIFCSKVAQKGKIFSRLLEPQKVAANAKSCSKVVKHNRERPYYLNTQNQLRCRVSPKLTVQFTSKKEHSLNNMIKSLRYVLGHSRLSDFSLILLRDGRASKSRECARNPHLWGHLFLYWQFHARSSDLLTYLSPHDEKNEKFRVVRSRQPVSLQSI